MIYVFEFKLTNGRFFLHTMVECVEGKDVNDARNKLEELYSGEWKVGNATLIGSHKHD